MTFLKLTTSSSNFYCGTNAIGHMIILKWDQLKQESKDKIVHMVNDCYQLTPMLSEAGFISLMRQLSGYDVQKIMSYPLVEKIKVFNEEDQVDFYRFHFINVISWIINTRSNHDNYQTQFQVCIKQYNDNQKKIILTKEGFNEQFRHLDLSSLKKLAGHFAINFGYNINDLQDGMQQNYQLPNSFFEGSQLVRLMNDLKINSKLFYSKCDEPICSNNTFSNSPCFSLITDYSHWESILFADDVEQFKDVNDRFEENNVFNNNSELRSVKAFLLNANEPTARVNELIQLYHRQNRQRASLGGKGVFIPMHQTSEPIHKSPSVISDSTTESTHSNSPLLDECPWGQMVTEYERQVSNQKISSNKAIEHLNQEMVKDQSDKYIKRPDVRRAELNLHLLYPVMNDIHDLYQKQDQHKRMKKYQLISVLYHIQAAFSGRSIVMSLGTGTGKTMIMGMVSTLLAKHGKTVILIENTKKLKDEHRKNNDYPFTAKNSSIQILEDLSDEKMSTTSFSSGIVWTTLNQFKRFIKDKPNFGPIFSSKDTVIILDEAHGVITEQHAKLPQNDIEKDEWLTKWIEFNKHCIHSGVSIGSYTATPGALTKQLRAYGAAFGQKLQYLLNNHHRNDRYPALIQEGSMVAYYMDTTKELNTCVFDELSTEQLDSLCQGNISFTDGQKNINYLYEYLTLVYLICVADGSYISNKNENRNLISLILRKMRFIHSIRLILNVIADFSHNPRKYIDVENDSLRTIFYVKDFNDDVRANSSLQKIIEKVKTKYLGQNNAWADLNAFKKYVESLKLSISDEAWAFIKKYNLFFDDNNMSSVKLQHIHQLLPMPEESRSSNAFNLKSWMQQWVAKVHNCSALNNIDFAMDVDAKKYGDEKHKMLIISKSSSVGTNITAKGKVVKNIFLSVPASNLEFIQVVGRFSRMSTLGDELATMTFAMTKKEDWFTLYTLFKLKNEVTRKLGHRIDGKTAPIIIKQMEDVSRCIKVGQTERHLKYFTCTLALNSISSASNELKSIMHGHYKFKQGRLAGTELLLYLANIQNLVTDEHFARLKSDVSNLRDVAQSSLGPVDDLYSFSDNNIRLCTKTTQLMASQNWIHRASVYMDAILKCSNITEEGITRVNSVDSFVVEFSGHDNHITIRDEIIKDITNNDGLLSILSNFTEEDVESMREYFNQFLTDIIIAKRNAMHLTNKRVRDNSSVLQHQPRKKQKTVAGESSHCDDIPTGINADQMVSSGNHSVKRHAQKSVSSSSQGVEHILLTLSSSNQQSNINSRSSEQSGEYLKIDKSLNSDHAKTLCQYRTDLIKRRDEIIEGFFRDKREHDAVQKHIKNLKYFTNRVCNLFDELNANNPEYYHWIYPIYSVNGAIKNHTTVFIDIIEYSSLMIQEIEAAQVKALTTLFQKMIPSKVHLVTLSHNLLIQLQKHNSNLYAIDENEAYQFSLLCSAIMCSNYSVLAWFKDQAYQDNLQPKKIVSLCRKIFKEKNSESEYAIQLVFQMLGDYLSEIQKRPGNIDLNAQYYFFRQCSIFEVLRDTDAYKGDIKRSVLRSPEAKQLYRIVKENLNLLYKIDYESGKDASKIKLIQLFLQDYIAANPMDTIDELQREIEAKNGSIDFVLPPVSNRFRTVTGYEILEAFKTLLKSGEYKSLSDQDRDQLYSLITGFEMLQTEGLFSQFVKEYDALKVQRQQEATHRQQPIYHLKKSLLQGNEKGPVQRIDSVFLEYKKKLSEFLKKNKDKLERLNQKPQTSSAMITLLKEVDNDFKWFKSDFKKVIKMLSYDKLTGSFTAEDLSFISKIANKCQATNYDKFALIKHLDIDSSVKCDWISNHIKLLKIPVSELSIFDNQKDNKTLFDLYLNELCNRQTDRKLITDILSKMSLHHLNHLDDKHFDMLLKDIFITPDNMLRANWHFLDSKFKTHFIADQYLKYINPQSNYSSTFYEVTGDFEQFINHLAQRKNDNPQSLTPLDNLYYTLFVSVLKERSDGAGKRFLEFYGEVKENNLLPDIYRISLFNRFIQSFLNGDVKFVRTSELVVKMDDVNTLDQQNSSSDTLKEIWSHAINEFRLHRILTLISDNKDELSQCIAKMDNLRKVSDKTKLYNSQDIDNLVESHAMSLNLMNDPDTTLSQLPSDVSKLNRLSKALKQLLNFIYDKQTSQMRLTFEDVEIIAFAKSSQISLDAKVGLLRVLIATNIYIKGRKQAKLLHQNLQTKDTLMSLIITSDLYEIDDIELKELRKWYPDIAAMRTARENDFDDVMGEDLFEFSNPISFNDAYSEEGLNFDIGNLF